MDSLASSLGNLKKRERPQKAMQLVAKSVLLANEGCLACTGSSGQGSSSSCCGDPLPRSAIMKSKVGGSAEPQLDLFVSAHFLEVGIRRRMQKNFEPAGFLKLMHNHSLPRGTKQVLCLT